MKLSNETEYNTLLEKLILHFFLYDYHVNIFDLGTGISEKAKTKYYTDAVFHSKVNNCLVDLMQ